MCDENGWTRVGVLDLPQLPYDLTVPNAIDVPWSAIHPEPDEAELAMYRRAAKMAREILSGGTPSWPRSRISSDAWNARIAARVPKIS